MSPSYCLVVPHYNHDRQFLQFLPLLEQHQLPIVIVDDGSSEHSVAAIRNYTKGKTNIHLTQHAHNRGKGAAVKTGLVFARILGFDYAIQIDADGQHNHSDIEKFIATSRENPQAIICGKPVFDDSVPKARLHGRKITTFFVALETLSRKIKDGLCGFRVYPLGQVERILDRYRIGCRMDFDTELLVKAIWANVPLVFIDTKVIYPEQGVSNFNYVRENLLLIKLHTRLLLGMIVLIPLLLFYRFTS